MEGEEADSARAAALGNMDRFYRPTPDVTPDSNVAPTRTGVCSRWTRGALSPGYRGNVEEKVELDFYHYTVEEDMWFYISGWMF